MHASDRFSPPGNGIGDICQNLRDSCPPNGKVTKTDFNKFQIININTVDKVEINWTVNNEVCKYNYISSFIYSAVIYHMLYYHCMHACTMQARRTSLSHNFTTLFVHCTWQTICNDNYTFRKMTLIKLTTTIPTTFAYIKIIIKK